MSKKIVLYKFYHSIRVNKCIDDKEYINYTLQLYLCTYFQNIYHIKYIITRKEEEIHYENQY